jgi:hypothetical protein
MKILQKHPLLADQPHTYTTFKGVVISLWLAVKQYAESLQVKEKSQMSDPQPSNMSMKTTQ